MINVNSNMGQVAGSLSSKLNEFSGVIKDKVLRTVATTLLGEVKERIHDEGKKADGTQIGEYSSSYLKKRQRKPYNRTSDKKKIYSLTRKMENEFTVIATDNGYGLGWLDAGGGSGKNSISNFQKSKFLEERDGKVYALMNREQSLIKPVADRVVKEELSRLNLL